MRPWAMESQREIPGHFFIPTFVNLPVGITLRPSGTIDNDVSKHEKIVLTYGYGLTAQLLSKI
jgi:hypothetical protein